MYCLKIYFVKSHSIIVVYRILKNNNFLRKIGILNTKCIALKLYFRFIVIVSSYLFLFCTYNFSIDKWINRKTF